MFIVNLTYTRPMADIEALLDAHISWLDNYFDKGIFITAGRKEPRTGGVILVKDIDAKQLDTILAEDPFVAVADYSVIKVNITRTAADFNILKNI
ncbi:YciI family protein [Erwinia tasmaniensis]|uniref:YciI family protein n=1 Tax=Erwinia tasmaniensis TaxID=338565 RepID=UPI003A4E14FA